MLNSKNIDQSGRVKWLDVLKGSSILLVMLYHSSNYFFTTEAVGINPLVQTLIAKFNYFIGYARMPAFFLASGIVLAQLRHNKYEWIIHKRIPTMLWAIIVWTLIYALTDSEAFPLYPGQSVPLFYNNYDFPHPYGVLWFIYALLFLSLIVAVTNMLSTCYIVCIFALASALVYIAKESLVVFRILCHFFILCKREMTHDQTNIRHGSRTASSA